MVETIRFARRVSTRVKSDKIEEFLSTMTGKVYPDLSRQPGLRRIYLLRDTATPNGFISVTLWDSKEDADAYESGGAYAANVSKISDLLEEAPVATGLAVEFHSLGSGFSRPAAAKARKRTRKKVKAKRHARPKRR